MPAAVAGSVVRVTDGQRTYMLDVVEVRGKPSARDDSNGRGVSIGLLEGAIALFKPPSEPSAPLKAARLRFCPADKEASSAPLQVTGKLVRV